MKYFIKQIKTYKTRNIGFVECDQSLARFRLIINFNNLERKLLISLFDGVVSLLKKGGFKLYDLHYGGSKYTKTSKIKRHREI